MARVVESRATSLDESSRFGFGFGEADPHEEVKDRHVRVGGLERLREIIELRGRTQGLSLLFVARSLSLSLSLSLFAGSDAFRT